MSTTEASSDATGKAGVGQVDMRLEVVVIPVSDVERAKQFYEGLGWRLDADLGDETLRIVQFNPPGSACSVQFGVGLTSAAPGSAQSLLVVSDIEAAHDELVANGANPGEIFHDTTVGYNRFNPDVRASGPDPERRTYASFGTFSDPDGNEWQLQEITDRLPGRIDSATTSFTSTADLTAALKRAAAAHGEHEKQTGAADPDWPGWYAAFMVAEQSGEKPPS